MGGGRAVRLCRARFVGDVKILEHIMDLYRLKEPKELFIRKN